MARVRKSSASWSVGQEATSTLRCMCARCTRTRWSWLNSRLGCGVQSASRLRRLRAGPLRRIDVAFDDLRVDGD